MISSMNTYIGSSESVKFDFREKCKSRQATDTTRSCNGELYQRSKVVQKIGEQKVVLRDL